MIILLSPAKLMDETDVRLPVPCTLPAFQEVSAALVVKLRTYSAVRLGKLMGISKDLAELTHARYRDWSLPFSPPGAKAAMFLFAGEAYKGLDAGSFTADDLHHAQQRLRILSGLHGVLRPLDLVRPYRLEMDTKLSMGRGRKDLYAFWGDRITDAVNEALRTDGGGVLLNLASAEYFKGLHPASIQGRVITPVFMEQGPGGLRTVAMRAKHQRGAMCRWVLRNRLHDPEQVKAYDGDGHRFIPGLSTADRWMFVRGSVPLR